MKQTCRPLAFALCLIWFGIATGQDEAQPAGEREQIAAAIQAYVTAFNAEDVDGLISLWAPSGVYISRTSGERIQGHDAMKKDYADIFSGDSPPKLEVTTDSIEFISPSVALERGTALVMRGETTEETTYRAVYMKSGKQWLLDRVTEEQQVRIASNYEHLKNLEWLVGDWVDAGEGISIDLECRWTANKNFISRKYSVSTEQGFVSSGLQIIGWDAKTETIRSWLFDSDGGFISGTWTPRDERWIVQSVASLPDGKTGSYTSVFQPQPDGNYLWKKINRVLDGRIMPNVDQVLVQRK